MNNLPLVSVIIPCYNHEKYIEQSILSVINQTYKNIELIVIDDGSKDNSSEIIKNMQKKFEFTFISQKNQGVCRTLNQGVLLSKGKYIAIIASDDYWDTSKIQKQIEELKKNQNSEFCFTQAIEFDDFNKKRIFPKRFKIGNVLNFVFIKDFVPAGSMMFSRKLFDRLKGFNENLQAEDWDFVIRSAANTEFCVVKEPLLYYRSHDSNTMKTTPRKEIFRQKALILLTNYNLVSPYIWLLSIFINFTHDIIIKRGK